MKTRTTTIVGELEEGQYLPDFDNGYVVENVRADECFSSNAGGYNALIGDNYRCITFHDQLGTEQYLILDEDFEISTGTY